MAKLVLKTKCESIQQGANRGAVMLGADITELPAAAAGGPRNRVAKTIVNIIFSDPNEAAKFKVGKEYPVTVDL